MRTIKTLRDNYQGKLYVILRNEDVARRFLSDAQAEGYHFGNIDPEDKHISDMIAVEDNRRLSYVGSIGRTAFQAGVATGIDYEKYITGDDDYIVRK